MNFTDDDIAPEYEKTKAGKIDAYGQESEESNTEAHADGI